MQKNASETISLLFSDTIPTYITESNNSKEYLLMKNDSSNDYFKTNKSSETNEKLFSSLKKDSIN